MSRRLTGGIAVALVAALLALGSAWPASAEVAADEYVLYYTVTSAYQGNPETLGGIAERYLGEPDRATELFNLNSGRKQPDGGALSDAEKLTAGWYIVLPWDAVGAGVQYGVLPSGSPAPGGATSTPKPGSTPTKGGTSNGGGNNNPGGGTPKPGSTPSAGGSPAAPPPVSPRGPAEPSGKCITATVASSPSNWAFVRLAPEQAWAASRGIGQMVAVIDSGVDGSKVQLSGRMSTGANLVTGEARGDTDCLGTGTAMAGLIAAKQNEGDTFGGVAPDSVIMPVAVVTDGKSPATEDDQATAILTALSAGATVLALGSYTDVTLPAVRKQVENALSKGVTVVAGARTDGAALPDDVITVGGVGQDGKTVEEYAAQAVDVVAPGANITSLGAGSTKPFVGSGTQYAVALVAGTAALVRSAHPDLKADQVAHRVAVTADKMGDAQPDSRYGYGMVNPEKAVTTTLAEEAVPINSQNRAVGDLAGGDGVRIAFVLTVLAGLALSTLLVFRVMRGMNRDRAERNGSDPDQPGPFNDGSPPATPAV